jgi:hypothetical protein
MTDVIYLAGVERSGTNFLQWLFKENFKDLIIITTYKHYSPRDIISEIDWNSSDKCTKEQQARARKFAQQTAIIAKRGWPPLAFVSKGIKPPELKVKSQFVEDAIFDSIVNKTMKFLVNIKNPYGWHLSYTKHWKRIPFPEGMKHWQDVYHDWAEFYDKYPQITEIVRHEDVLKDYALTLKKLCSSFNLTKEFDKYKTVDNVLTTTSDTYKNKKFERAAYFINEEYVPQIQKSKVPELKRCKKILNKDLVERFGYKVL